MRLLRRHAWRPEAMADVGENRSIKTVTCNLLSLIFRDKILKTTIEQINRLIKKLWKID
jgi:hypothetical protein